MVRRAYLLEQAGSDGLRDVQGRLVSGTNLRAHNLRDRYGRLALGWAKEAYLPSVLDKGHPGIVSFRDD